MTVVHKFEVFYGAARCQMPADAEVLAVGAIAGRMYVWAKTSEPGQLTTRQVGYFATGDQVPDDATYIGTAITTDGAFVWHVFQGPRLTEGD